MKRIAALLAVFLCPFVIAHAMAADKAAAPKAVDKAVAPKAADKAAGAKAAVLVNGVAVSEREIGRELEFIRTRFQEKGRTISDEQLAEVRSDVVERLVRKELLFQASAKEGITIAKDEVDKSFQMVKAQYKDQKDFAAMLQKFGLTEEEVRTDIGRDMAVKRLIDTRFVSKTLVSEEESRAYYEKMKENFRRPESVRASHILIKAKPEAPAADKAKAKERLAKIRERLVAGEDFATLARELSEGPSAAKGGDLGFFGRSQMDKAFEDVAFSLKPGQLSEIVETSSGYHVIKVAERTEASTASYDDVKERITEFLKQDKIQKDVTAYVETLKRQAKVVTP